MTNYLKNNTEYGVFVLESSSAYNDDWITDHAGDPGEADLALYTEGLEMTHCADAKMIDSQGTSNYESEATYMGWEVIGIGAGKKDKRTFQDDKQFISYGGEVDETHLEYFQRAFKEFNISRTSIDRFLVWMTGVDAYKNWYDEDGNAKDYCPVIWRGFQWRYNFEQKFYEIVCTYEVVWD